MNDFGNPWPLTSGRVCTKTPPTGGLEMDVELTYAVARATLVAALV